MHRQLITVTLLSPLRCKTSRQAALCRWRKTWGTRLHRKSKSQLCLTSLLLSSAHAKVIQEGNTKARPHQPTAATKPRHPRPIRRITQVHRLPALPPTDHDAHKSEFFQPDGNHCTHLLLAARRHRCMHPLLLQDVLRYRPFLPELRPAGCPQASRRPAAALLPATAASHCSSEGCHTRERRRAGCELMEF